MDTEIAQWCKPVRTAAAERVSLSFQAGRYKVCPPPTDKMRIKAMARLLSCLPEVQLKDGRMESRTRAAIKNLTGKASPGYPYMRWAKTNKELLALKGVDWLVGLVLERIARINAAPREAFLTWTAEECVAAFLMDPIRIFGKNEVHGLEKVRDGRLRLIASVSIVDQLVERVMNSELNQACIDRWSDLPVMPGMGLNDEGLEVLLRRIRAMSSQVGTDMSGFDFSVQQWMIDDESTMRAARAGDHSETSFWWKRGRLLGLAMFVLSDGEMWCQRVRGIQKSGSYNTSSGNSTIRAYLHELIEAAAEEGNPQYARQMQFCADAVALRVMAMGDDCVESIPPGMTVEQLVEAYARLGVKVKEAQVAASGGCVEFCGQTFDLRVGASEPVRWHKMVASFLANWPQAHDFASRIGDLSRELRHSSQREWALHVIHQVAVDAGSEVSQ